MREIQIEANTARLYELQAFFDEELERAGCPPELQLELDMVVEEIFVNIASYAYPEDATEKPARAAIDFNDETRTVLLRFYDRGRPYDPLSGKMPDLSLPAEERPIGGLGVYLVREVMDKVTYEYRDGYNILSAEKRFP